MVGTTFRSVRKTEFTQIGNNMLWDDKLSLQAKGLLSIFLSNSNDWEINTKEIIKRSKNGRDSHYNTIKELIQKGYFARIEILNNRAFESMEYIFSDNKKDVEHEISLIENEILKNNKQCYIEYGNRIDNTQKAKHKNKEKVTKIPHPEKPYAENKDTENKDTENPYINNTKENNTKENNTKENNTNLSIKDEEIENTNLPLQLQKTIQVNKDRLIDSKISLNTIKTTCDAFLEDTPLNTINLILQNVLANSKGQIRNFNNYFSISLNQYYENLQKQKEAINYKEDESTEVIPDWFYERKKKQNHDVSKESDAEDLEDIKKLVAKHS